MRIRSIFLRFTSLAILIAAGGVVANAQSYYDDDIYYDASKAKKEAKPKQNKKLKQNKNNGLQYYYDGAQYVPWTNVGEFEAADKQYTAGTSTRDVDEYNRRYTGKNTKQTDSTTSQKYNEYSNTRNLARFHNSEDAQQAYASSMGNDIYSNEDGSYEAYIAATQPESVITVNLIGIGSPYYNTSWYWNRWGYDPFWGYAPYWGSSWGYWGPSWSWSWGWGWYDPSWSWGWVWCCHPHYHHHHHGWYPSYYNNYTSTGAYRPNVSRRHNGSYSTSGRFNRGSVNRSTSFDSQGIRNGYNSGNINRNQTTTVTRPGYRLPTTNPNSTESIGRGRGYFGSGKGTVNRNVQKNSNSGINYNYNSNQNNYNQGNSYNHSRGRSSSRSFGRGSSGMSRGSSHSMGGGSHRSGGGGGHRGR